MFVAVLAGESSLRISQTFLNCSFVTTGKTFKLLFAANILVKYCSYRIKRFQIKHSLSLPEYILILPAGALGDPVTPECGVEVDTCCRVPRPALQVVGRDAVGPCTALPVRQRPGGLRGTDLVTLVITGATPVSYPVTDVLCSKV